MLCLECGQKYSNFLTRLSKSGRSRYQRKSGFVLEDHSLYMYGVCEGMKTSGKCSMKKKKRG